MCKDVKCLCGAEFNQVDLSESQGWFTCPKCGCTTNQLTKFSTFRPATIPEFDMQSLAAAFKEKKA